MRTGPRDAVSAAVPRVMRKLGSLDKFIFYLRIEAGMKVKEIAEIVGFTPDKTSCRLRRVYSMLKEEVK